MPTTGGFFGFSARNDEQPCVCGARRCPDGSRVGRHAGIAPETVVAAAADGNA